MTNRERLRELARRIDAGKVRAGVVVGRRDRAVLVLYAAGLASPEVAALRGTDLALEGDGRVRIRLQTTERVASILLDPEASAEVLAWIEEWRLWGVERALFNGTGPEGIRQIVFRYWRQDRLAQAPKGALR